MRIFNSILAGLLTGILLYFLFALITLKAALLAFCIGWPVFAILFYQNSYSAGKIWSKACLVAAVECLVIPLATWTLPFIRGQQAVQTAKQGAQAAGQAYGSTLGGGLVNILSGYTGILIGLLLLVMAYFSLKPSRRRC